MAALTLRSVKGTPLTNSELDANFTALNTELGQKLVASSNLSDLTNATTARTNLGLGNVEDKSSATIRGELTSGNVTTALGFTPYNATNPSAYVSAAGARSALSFVAGSGAYNSTTGVITIPTNTNQLTNGAGFITSSASITGNAATATTLQTARTINGVSFNGSANITVTTAGTGIGVSGTAVSIAAAYSPNTSTELATAVDLNTLQTAGFYYQTANADAAAGSNYPVAQAGSLLIQRSAGVTQQYQTYGTSDTELYFRSFYNTVWGSWRRVLTSANYNSFSPTLTGTGASGTWGISISGSAATLTTGRTIAMTGDVTWTSAAFNGSANVTGTATLANSGVTAGTYTKVTVDAKGRVTAGASLASADLPTYTGTLTSSQVTTALGFTPYNSSNPSGYITSSGSISGNAATATNISNTGTVTLASATESNSIYITAPSYTTDTPVKLLNFDWYGNLFSMGNIRSGSTPSNGFGIYYTASGGSRTEIARFGTGGSFNAIGAITQNGNQVLHAGNYTSYSPSLTGSGASGTWGINITGNAATATTLQTARTINGVSFNGSTNITITAAANGGNSDTVDSLHAASFFRSDAANSVDARLAAGDGRGLRFWDSDSYKIWMSASTNTTWGGRIAGETTSDYNIYFRIVNGTNRGFVFENAYATKLFAINGDGVRSAVTVTAPTFSGSLSGNASTATALQTARTINGVSFNGTANITVADSTKLPLAGGTMTGAITFAAGQTWPTFNQNTTGNAATATALQTARLIGGVSFNGTANINLPGVNTTGNQNTTGSAATLTTARTINGTSFNGSANITTANWGTARDINGTSVNGSTNYAIGRIYDTNYRRITNPGGAEYVTTTATITGAIAVTLPVGITNTMVRMAIKVYEYTTTESFEVHVGGYNTTGGTWANNPFAYIIGNPGVDRRFNVRLGYNATTTRFIVYIGELASTWSYPQVNVTEVLCGYSGTQVAWTTGWSIGFEATAFQSVTATISNCQVGYAVSTNTANSAVLRDGSGNFSAGTITASLSGNASTATALQTARTINGVSFNGTANITITSATLTTARLINGTSFNGSANITTANWGTARTLTIGATGKSVNGSANVAWTLAEITGTTAAPQFGSLGIGTAASGTTGEIRATNNITANYSDDRLKTRLGRIEGALDKLCSLEGFYYEANETAQALGYKVKREVGVSAQQIQAVMPEIVAPAPIDEQYLTVRYERALPLVIEAIKELRADVARIKKLAGD